MEKNKEYVTILKKNRGVFEIEVKEIVYMNKGYFYTKTNSMQPLTCNTTAIFYSGGFTAFMRNNDFSKDFYYFYGDLTKDEYFNNNIKIISITSQIETLKSRAMTIAREKSRILEEMDSLDRELPPIEESIKVLETLLEECIKKS